MKIVKASLLALAIVAAPSVASAGPIQYAGMGQYEVVRIGGMAGQVGAGEIMWTWEGGTPAGWDDVIYTYCVDLFTGLHTTQYVTQDVIDNLPSGEGGSIAWLYNTFAGAAHGSSALAAGLQLAIWNVLYDSDSSVNYGAFFLAQGSDAARAAANSYLEQLASAGALGTATWLNTDWGQDQVTAAPVPEPATLLLLGSGVAALAARRRRMQKAQA